MKLDKIGRDRVDGFLYTQGTKILNGKGEEIILTGWGLGNWLLCEGYMWKSYGSERFDRPHRIETVIRELTGSEYEQKFWKQYRENYITKEDIRYMAELGYNSVRIPLNWRIFMEAEPGLLWKEDGFLLLDRCMDWCEEHRLYVFLDLHGAPGGQTGANIDDCIDNVPRLFLDEDSWYKGIKLWEKLAQRYKDRWILAGYDLLNEPIAPGNQEKNFDYLLPKLEEFYEEAIKAIRKVDTKHLISIEGHHWATNPSVFHKKYDDNMIIHFHRYACMPDISAFSMFMSISEKLEAPLWMGETGENLIEWFTAMYPLSVTLGIGYNLWPWKKMNCTNSCCSIRVPEGWDQIIAYTKGGVHPGYQQAQTILDEFLENIKLDHCDCLPEVTQAVFRKPGCKVRATDFDEFPGKGISYSGTREDSSSMSYRNNTNMCIYEKLETTKRRFAFDCGWDRFALELTQGEFSSYSVYEVNTDSSVSFDYYCDVETEIVVLQDNDEICRHTLTSKEGLLESQRIGLKKAAETSVMIVVKKGKILLDCIRFHQN